MSKIGQAFSWGGGVQVDLWLLSRGKLRSLSQHHLSSFICVVKTTFLLLSVQPYVEEQALYIECRETSFFSEKVGFCLGCLKLLCSGDLWTYFIGHLFTLDG